MAILVLPMTTAVGTPLQMTMAAGMIALELETPPKSMLVAGK
jgi:hypothetical protein